MAREQKYKTSRILEIDEIIRSGSFPNATTLSKKLEVSKSTIQRDIDFLRDRYRAPIEYDEVQHGYYYTDDSFFVKNVILTEGELFAISIAGPLLEQYKNTPLRKSLKSVFKKITAILPDEVTVPTSIFSDEMTFVADRLPLIDEDIFVSVFAAIRDKRTIRFEYKSVARGEFAEREADPLHVVVHQGDWHLIAYCHVHNEIRTFSLARMKSVVRTKNVFKAPKGFDAKNYYDTDFGVWVSDEPVQTVELLFEPRMEMYLSERLIHAEQTIKRQKDGKILVRFKSRQLKRIRNWVLQFADAVKVLNPPELVDMVKGCVNAMKKLY